MLTDVIVLFPDKATGLCAIGGSRADTSQNRLQAEIDLIEQGDWSLSEHV